MVYIINKPLETERFQAQNCTSRARARLEVQFLAWKLSFSNGKSLHHMHIMFGKDNSKYRNTTSYTSIFLQLARCRKYLK